MIRAFFAILLGPDIARLHAAVHAACTARFPELRWVAPGNLHLTMRFLGDTEERLVRSLESLVGESLSSLVPFRLALGAPGAFGASRRPRTLWLGLGEGAESAAEVARRVEGATERLGFARERRPWSPHITVARNPRGAVADGWEEAFRQSELPGSVVTVENVALVASSLEARGPVYTTLCSLPLGRSATTNPHQVP